MPINDIPDIKSNFILYYISNHLKTSITLTLKHKNEYLHGRSFPDQEATTGIYKETVGWLLPKLK